MQSNLLPPPNTPPLTATQASIVCGTDFSESATRAVEVGAALAQRLGETLVLTHAVNDQPSESLPGELRESLSLYARAQLHDERERLQAMHVEMVEAFHTGAVGAVLLEEAASRHARLLILGAAKRRSLSRRLVGSVSESVAEAADSPTLVVRDSTPLLQWARGERRLRVFVGADLSAPSEAALRWVAWLRQVAPCDVVAACLDAGIPTYPTTDLFPSLLMDEMVLKAAHVQERYFRERVRSLLGRSRVRVRYEKNWGHSDAHLIQLAGEERADLIVIGTHSRCGWHRLGHHSVSRGVLRYAPLNVVCVPSRATEQLRSDSATLNRPCNHQAHEN